MEKLFLFTRAFPFDKGEPYLEVETKYYEQFEEIHIFALSAIGNVARQLEGKNIYVHRTSFKNPLFYLLLSITTLFNADFYRELHFLYQTKRFNFKNIFNLIIFCTRAVVDTRTVNKIIKEKSLIQKSDRIVLYSYRFDFSSYIVAKLKLDGVRVVKRVSRAHGIDLYEFRSHHYLPLRTVILEKLTFLVLVSKEGLEYCKKQYPEFSSKFILSYLGTAEVPHHQHDKHDVLEVVSISNVLPVKRVDLLYQSLQELDIPIKWTHFGEGSGFNQLHKMVQETKEHVSITLKGHISNDDLLKTLSMNRPDVMVNVSSSEGLPVSIMEALSLGIPVIATNVGGTSEIIHHQVNGLLLSANPPSDEIAASIYTFYKMSKEEYKVYSNNAYSAWKKQFDSNINYTKFANFLYKLIDKERK